MSNLAMLFNMVINFAMLLIFIRFMLQFAGLERSNPMVEPAYKATQVVDLFGRIFPTVGSGRISLAAIALLFLLKLIDLSGNASLAGVGYTPIELFFFGTMDLILSFIRAARYLIFGAIIISWIVLFTQKMHPILGIIMQLAEPILSPFRRITPNLGMIDLSPLFAIFGLLLVEIIISTLVENIAPML